MVKLDLIRSTARKITKISDIFRFISAKISKLLYIYTLRVEK